MFSSRLCILPFLLLQLSMASCMLLRNETDRMALLHFKSQITDDPLGALSSWNNSVHFCKWYGVTCSRRHQRVTKLVLQHKQLKGTISPFIGNFSFLRELNLANNNFHSQIPPQIGGLRRLQMFHVSDNKLVGSVPFLDKLQQLQTISVYNNHLGNGRNGDLNFLCSMTNAASLRAILLQNNNFGGVLPECIGSLSSGLQNLVLNSNKLWGRIPVSIGNLVRLEVLHLQDNSLTGIIPSTIGKLSKLKCLYVSHNKLYGRIPSSLGNLSMLLSLTLGGNYLDGIIPQSLANCKGLLILDLSNNNLNGTIPPQIMTVSSLQSVYLQKNNLTGTLPEEIGNLRSLEELDVSDNMLIGRIPVSLGSCTSLRRLSMRGNYFQGNIPSSFSSLRGLVHVDLSQNNLSGKIPIFLEGLSSECLNLSYNSFEGAVPTGGMFNNTIATSVVGNEGLCGGIPQFHLQSCNKFSKAEKKRLPLLIKLLVSIIPAVSGIIIILSFILCWSRKKKQEPVSTILDNSLLRLSYQDLHHATNGFSFTNLIGVGNFGSVYKGTLDQGTTSVAVKVLNLQHQKAFKSFVTECTVLRNIRHRNLVKVVSACSSVDHQGNDFLALVYEFMVNGNLDTWLHPDHQWSDKQNVEPRRLTFLQRLNIAIDVAFALEYLHNDCATPIAHCDLKPCNVLLDAEMTGHIGDFGLGRLLWGATPDISTQQSSSLGVKGTVGYAAPEYGLGSEVTTKGDIYSYGILLLEMFTGKRPTNDIFNEDMTLHKYVEAAIPDRAFEILDPRLVQEIQEEEACRFSNRRKAIIAECLISIFEVGVNCSLESPAQRMQISDVVAQLRVVKQKLSHIMIGRG